MNPQELREWEFSFQVMATYDLRDVRRILEAELRRRRGTPR